MRRMRTSYITRIIQRAYGRRYNLEPYYRPDNVATSFRYYLTKIQPAVAIVKQKRVQIISLLVFALLTVTSIYYYNLLVISEQDVMAAKGKVDTLLQRRNDISINLSKAVFDYSKHEQGVFTAVVTLRSLLAGKGGEDTKLTALMQNLKSEESMMNSQPPAKIAAVKPDDPALGTEPLSPLARLLAVAERYPDLKLSANFLNLMTALVDVEKDLAAERIKFNDTVNIYTTNIAKFPINVYAKIFTFDAQPYFEATEEAKNLKPIDY